MSEPQRRNRGCLRATMTFLLGGVVGFVVGGALAALFMWALNAVEREEKLSPLQDLAITKSVLTTDETRQYIDRLANDYLQSGDNVGLVIGIVKRDRSHVFGYGLVERGKTQTPDGDTIFELASVGKTFTATVLAEMVCRGEIDLHARIEEILPEHVKTPQFRGRSINLLDLATQSSGLPSLPDNMPAADPLNPMPTTLWT